MLKSAIGKTEKHRAIKNLIALSPPTEGAERKPGNTFQSKSLSPRRDMGSALPGKGSWRAHDRGLAERRECSPPEGF